MGLFFAHHSGGDAMARIPVVDSKTFAVRLTPVEREKLRTLCQATQLQGGEVLRWLIRLAQPSHVPPLLFEAPQQQGGHHAQ
jgi:hypothetical protein